MLRRIIAGIIFNAIAIFAVVYYIPEVIIEGGIAAYILIGFIAGILNLLVKPILTLISLPFMIISAGLFIFVINAAILWLITYILPIIDVQGIRLTIPSISDFLIASIIFTLVNGIEHWIFAPRKH